MRSLRLWVGICVLAFTGAAAVAGPRLQSLPHRYAPNSLDGPVVQASVDQTGITWAAWAYRHGAEYDIALSHLDGSGYWSEPTFLGRNDGRNQAEPFLVTDTNGTAYLAFTDFSSGRILLSTRPIWGTEWSEPQAVSAPDVRASAASLLVVRDRLVVAFRAAGRIRMLELPLLDPREVSEGIIDNPDPTDRQPPTDKQDDGSDDGWKPPEPSGSTTTPKR